MKIQEINTSYDEIMGNLYEYRDIFLDNKILCFRQVNLSIEEQLSFHRHFNELLGLFPNTKDIKKKFEYTENHSHVTGYKKNDKNTIIVDWHLEHSETPYAQSIGYWNMQKFDCNEGSGRTVFVDSFDILNLLTLEEYNFLKLSTVTGTESESLDEKGVLIKQQNRPALGIHPYRNIECLRIDCSSRQRVIDFDGRPPTEEENKFFFDILTKICENIELNQSIRNYWSWSVGDLLVVDVHSLYHAVYGGFNGDDRVFTGLWGFVDNEEYRKVTRGVG